MLGSIPALRFSLGSSSYKILGYMEPEYLPDEMKIPYYILSLYFVKE